MKPKLLMISEDELKGAVIAMYRELEEDWTRDDARRGVEVLLGELRFRVKILNRNFDGNEFEHAVWKSIDD